MLNLNFNILINLNSDNLKLRCNNLELKCDHVKLKF